VDIMREKQFSLSRRQRDDMWRRYKQTDDRRIAERLHAILLLDAGQNAQSVCTILHIHSNTLKRWIKLFVNGGEAALTTLHYAGGEGNLTQAELEQFTTWLDAEVRTTVEAIAWLEQHTQLSYTDSGVRKLLARLDYRYKQPAVLPAKADPEAQAAWVKTYTAKKGR
jgi:transposase